MRFWLAFSKVKFRFKPFFAKASFALPLRSLLAASVAFAVATAPAMVSAAPPASKAEQATKSDPAPKQEAGSANKAAAAPSSGADEAAKKFADPKHVLAIVGDKEVRVEDIDHMAKSLEIGLGPIPPEERYVRMLPLYVEMVMLSTAAEKAGYASGPEFDQQMALARENVLQKIFFQKQVLDKISPQDIKARYDKEIASLPKEEEIRARHILVKTKAEAQQVINRLKKGEKFEDIAKKLSKDGSASVGGDLGYFSRGQMVKPFEAVAFALKVGEYTKRPVQTPFGWHVIKLEDRRIKQPPALDDVKDMLRNLIARDRAASVLQNLRKQYAVRYPDAEIAKAMEKAGANGPNIVNGEESDED